ncbi:TPA: hypothetical protein DEW47_00055 [Patescibacteria group bacterium]|nr:hypothetical protein [Patescibacteria group bacterium]
MPGITTYWDGGMEPPPPPPPPPLPPPPPPPLEQADEERVIVAVDTVPAAYPELISSVNVELLLPQVSEVTNVYGDTVKSLLSAEVSVICAPGDKVTSRLLAFTTTESTLPLLLTVKSTPLTVIVCVSENVTSRAAMETSGERSRDKIIVK